MHRCACWWQERWRTEKWAKQKLSRVEVTFRRKQEVEQDMLEVARMQQQETTRLLLRNKEAAAKATAEAEAARLAADAAQSHAEAKDTILAAQQRHMQELQTLQDNERRLWEEQVAEQRRKMLEQSGEVDEVRKQKRLLEEQKHRLEENLRIKTQEEEDAQENFQLVINSAFEKERELKELRRAAHGSQEAERQLKQKEREVEELNEAKRFAEQAKQFAEQEKQRATKEAEAAGSEVQAMETQVYQAREAIDVTERVIKEHNLISNEDDLNQEDFFLKPFGAIDATSFNGLIKMCPRECASCKECNLFVFAQGGFQSGFWRTPEDAEVDFQEAEKHGGIPPFVAQCVFKNGIEYVQEDGEPVQKHVFAATVREEYEEVTDKREVPCNAEGGTRLYTTTYCWRADFMKWLRRHHAKKADAILGVVKEKYVEWHAAGGSGYSIVRKMWNRRRNKEMTPKEKLRLVLEKAQLWHGGLD